MLKTLQQKIYAVLPEWFCNHNFNQIFYCKGNPRAISVCEKCNKIEGIFLLDKEDWLIK